MSQNTGKPMSYASAVSGKKGPTTTPTPTRTGGGKPQPQPQKKPVVVVRKGPPTSTTPTPKTSTPPPTGKKPVVVVRKGGTTPTPTTSTTTPISSIPKPPTGGPKLGGPTKTTLAGQKIDQGEASGGHARDRHVGKSDSYLKGRGKDVVTSYLTKSDQNKAVSELLDNSKVQKNMNKLDRNPRGTTSAGEGSTVGGKGGATWNKTASITRVKEEGKAPYNAKATQGKVELLKKDGKVNIHSAYATKPSGGFVPLEKPLPGGVKPTGKVSINKIDENAMGKLRKTEK